MSVSMENHSPFLDRKLFETAFSIPTRHLIRNSKAKSVLREAMGGIVPDPILHNHREVGFNAPIKDLIDLNDSNIKGQLFESNIINDFINRNKIEALLN